jgi:hypothetical protein
MSPATVNSALQRARETMDRSKNCSEEYSLMDLEPDQELLSRYVEAFEQFDIHALVALFHEEGHMSMPPFPMWVCGKDDLFQFFTLTLALRRITVFADYGEWWLSRSRTIYAEQRQNLLGPLGHSRHCHERQEDLPHPKFH